MEKTVTTIPPKLSRFTDLPLTATVKRKVAAYARVSTDHEEQQSSYEALNGGINLIITKSVSRFARNTVDSLSAIRKLKEHNVECYFEKENIWTFDSKCELMLSILSSISQEESRSISENVTWGHRRRMADGKVSVPFGRFLGYDRGEHGELIVNEKEAEVVREIYRLFPSGLTPHGIGKELTARHIPTPGGKVKWTASTVKSILTNEKYKGDALLQKTFTPDYLTKKTKKNDGQIPQYYVENSHPAIITAETIHAMFIRSFNEMIINKNEIIRNLRESIALASDMTELESKRDAANNEVLFLADIVEKLIAENARIPQDQKEYNKKYKTAIERYEKAKSAYDAIIALIKDENKRIQRMKSFIQNVQKLGVITEFDEMLWGLLVDKVVVYSRNDIRVEFKKYVE